MIESRRLKITKRQKDSLIDFNYQKQMPIEEAFSLQKSKNQTLKDKNDKLQIKYKLLYEKLYNQKYEPDDIFDNINDDIYQLDKTIKQLEQQLYFRYSKQMQKLKKKVLSFLKMINFQIDQQDLDQINDEISIILFLMQAFQLRYDELINENLQTEELIQKLREPELISGTAEKIKQLEEEVQFYIKENNQLKYLYQNHQKSSNYQFLQPNISIQSNNPNIHQYISRINDLESQKAILKLQIQKKSQRISLLQYEIDNLNRNAKIFQQQSLKFKKQENRWKQRYTFMQKQKNQRIKLLQTQLNRKIGLPDPDQNSLGFSN